MKEDKMQHINDTNKAPGNSKPTQKSQNENVTLIETRMC